MDNSEFVTTEVVMVNAAIAAKMLTFNKPHMAGVKDTNRRISKATVAKYAKAMLRGEWQLTHQGIGFRKDGTLEDGQHRLEAIVLAAETDPDIAIPLMVTSGLDHGVFQYIDTGQRRKLADVASSAGLKDSFQLAATARLFHTYMTVPYDGIASWSSVKDFSGIMMLDVVEKYPAIIEAVARVRNHRCPGNKTALSTGYALSVELRPDVVADLFMTRVENGQMLSDRDPAYLLRERCLAAVRGGKNTDKVSQLAWYVKAFNAFAADRTIGQLSLSEREAFPRIEAAPRSVDDGEEAA